NGAQTVAIRFHIDQARPKARWSAAESLHRVSWKRRPDWSSDAYTGRGFLDRPARSMHRQARQPSNPHFPGVRCSADANKRTARLGKRRTGGVSGRSKKRQYKHDEGTVGGNAAGFAPGTLQIDHSP